jgi:hypothetical protein
MRGSSDKHTLLHATSYEALKICAMPTWEPLFLAHTRSTSGPTKYFLQEGLRVTYIQIHVAQELNDKRETRGTALHT